jgi:hypothetical protein
MELKRKDEIIVIEDTVGTHLLDEIEIGYDKLVAKLGEPNELNDGYKTDAEWLVYTPVGIATIYNYKDGINYNGTDGTKVEDITNWHIGGYNNAVVDYIKKILS